jgi:hypothetical protein
MAFTNFLDAAILNHVFTGVSYTAPTALYVGLHTAAPTVSNEVATASYARKQSNFVIDGGNTVKNPVALNWNLGESFGVITHVAIYDAATGGNQLVASQLTSSLDGNNATQIQIDANQLQIQMIDA